MSDIPPAIRTELDALHAADDRQTAAIGELRRWMGTLEQDMREIRREISAGAAKVDESLANVHTALTTVFTKSLAAAPPWATVVIASLTAVAAVLIGAHFGGKL